MENNLDLLRKESQAEIIKCVEDNLLIITERMQRIGLNEHPDAVKWFSSIKNEVSTVMNLLIKETENHERNIMNGCIELLKRAEEYCKNLKIPMEPHGQNEELSLMQEKTLLTKRLEEYEVLLEAKLKEIKKLQKRNVAVSKILNEDPLPIDDQTIPTEKDYQDLLAEIEKREMKRFEREEKYIKTREIILKLVKEYEIQPITEFQKNINNMSIETVILSEENMNLLEEYYDSVQRKSKSICEKLEEMRLKVRSLWDLLSQDVQHCDEFVKRHAGSSPATLEAFRDELRRCEELRKTNIGHFVEKLRADIKVMWDQCHFSQEEKGFFKYINDTFYNEDLLELHERHLEKLHDFYNDNKTILLHLEDHENLWEKYKKLEEVSCDPKRLDNRGGKLLREEKQRNTVQKKLPKIDAELVELAKIYETKHGKPFHSYGRTIDEIINEKYENREQEKLLKLSARKMKNGDLTPGRSTSTLNLARSRLTPDIKSSVKRRILSPRNATTSKKARVLVVHKRSIQKIPIIKINSIQHDISIRQANKRKRIESNKRLSDFLNQKDDDAYNEFSARLGKADARSTLLISEPEDVLAVPLAKTPTKPICTKSPSGAPINKSAYKLAIASNKKIIL